MQSRRQSEVVRERAQRHTRLMKLIKSYNPTDEEIKRLEKIKVNTMMEINIRYLRSPHNRSYKFPKMQSDSEDEDEEEQDPFLNKKEVIIYDLNSQNSLVASKNPSQKVISLSSSRRVTSLEIDRNPWQRDRLLRLDMKAKPTQSSKLLSRKNSLQEKMRKQGSKLRLPQLKLEKARQNLKTETRAPHQEQEIQSVIGKKLVTEVSENRSKMHGVQKYLKKVEVRPEGRGNYRKKVFLLDRMS